MNEHLMKLLAAGLAVTEVNGHIRLTMPAGSCLESKVLMTVGGTLQGAPIDPSGVIGLDVVLAEQYVELTELEGDGVVVTHVLGLVAAQFKAVVKIEGLPNGGGRISVLPGAKEAVRAYILAVAKATGLMGDG